MHLSAEQFERIIRSLTPSPEGHGGRENRRAPRVRHLGTVTITPPGGGQPALAQVRDLSVRGLCLATTRPMDQGEQFLTHLGQAAGHATSLLCTVVHCRKTTGGLFNVGAEFTCVLDGAPATRPTGEARQGAELERIRQSVLE